jgi:hypothetical protein
MGAADRVRISRPEDLARQVLDLQALACSRGPDREHRYEVALFDHTGRDSGGEGK